jgi:uncharacterized protein
MPAGTARALVQGAAGNIEVASNLPGDARAVAVVAHPHPLFGGTMDNKVVTTIAKAFIDAGVAVFRFNFRGVGQTAGEHDEGRGETDDMLRVIEHARGAVAGVPLYLAGFSFGGAIATRASESAAFERLVLAAPGFRRISRGGNMGEAPDPNDPVFGSPGRHSAANTVVIHGDRDDTVPLSDSLAWATVREVPVVVVPGGEHFFHRKLHVLREVVGRWSR